MRACATWLSESEKSLIVDEALGVLERVGIGLQGSRALPVLAEQGAVVDAEIGVVRLPRELVLRAVDLCPRRIVLAASAPERDVMIDDGEAAHFCSSGCAAFVLDHRTGERRPSRLDDLRAATILLDEVAQVDVMWTTVTANDVPGEVRELTAYYTVLRESHKHVTFVDSPSQAEPILRMVELFGGAERFAERPRFSTLLTAASPLKVDGALLGFHATTAAHGVPVEVYTVPMAGATSPVTLAGTITQALAEFLGVAAAIQALAPGASLLMGASGSVMDMRAASISYGAPENALMNAACVELAHRLGVPAIVPGMATDAKYAGIQDGYEKALRGLTAASAQADLLSGGIGMIDSVNTLYLPQIVLDAEIAALIRRLLAPVEVSRETIMADMIERVGIGGNFLHEKETTRRLRAGEHFLPTVSTRLPYDAWKAESRDEVDVARQQMRELYVAHDGRPAPLDPAQLSELAAICEVPAEVVAALEGPLEAARF